MKFYDLNYLKTVHNFLLQKICFVVYEMCIQSVTFMLINKTPYKNLNIFPRAAFCFINNLILFDVISSYQKI